jgi:hypothetical protein
MSWGQGSRQSGEKFLRTASRQGVDGHQNAQKKKSKKVLGTEDDYRSDGREDKTI